MDHSTQISRYRPVVLALIGVVAAYSSYELYRIFSKPTPKPTLRRSNALRRARAVSPPSGARRPTGWEMAPPSESAPLGSIVISRRLGSVEKLEINVANGIPSAGALLAAFGWLPPSTDIARDLRVAAVQCVLQACRDVDTPALRRQLAERGLDELAEAMKQQDRLAATRHYRSLETIIPGVSNAELDSGLFLAMHVEIDVPDAIMSPTFLSEYGETEDTDGLNASAPDSSQGLKGLLYHIAEGDARRKAYEHRGVHCDFCGEIPIRGVRWHCLNCPDFDLCSTCEASAQHQETHVFAKIKIPLSILSRPTKVHPLWYPGDPRKTHVRLPAKVRIRLENEYSFEGAQMEAMYDQFECNANVPWPNDPNGIHAAIDKRAFIIALSCEGWPQRLRPNTVQDRIFAFYDTNNDGLIGFEEFVCGLAYLRGPKRFADLRRAIQGFDLNCDGYVERGDFIRMFRAKHEIQTLLVNTLVEGHEIEHTQAAMETIRSSGPISSVFSLDEIPQGGSRPLTGKVMDVYGDMQRPAEIKTVLRNDEGWSADTGRRPLYDRFRTGRNSRHILQQSLSRFREMLDDVPNGLEELNQAARSNDSDQNDNVVSSSDPEIRVTQLSDPNSTSREELPSTRSTNIPPSSTGTNNETAQQQGGNDTSLNQDVLWRIIEEGFHEMLDPLFEHRESLDQQAIASRPERSRRREEIDKFIQEKLDFQQELKAAASVDPLMATAMNSYEMDSEPRTTQAPQARCSLVGEIVATDAASLQQREADIANKPLQDLLDSSGYSLADGADDRIGHGSTEDRPEDLAHTSGLNSGHSRNGDIDWRAYGGGSIPIQNVSERSHDPTMPQHRADRDEDSIAAPIDVLDIDFKPQDHPHVQPVRKLEQQGPAMREHLERLIFLEEYDRKLQARGGQGRLSLDEVEAMINMDSSKELRGLVTSWLEWAAF